MVYDAMLGCQILIKKQLGFRGTCIMSLLNLNVDELSWLGLFGLK